MQLFMAPHGEPRRHPSFKHGRPGDEPWAHMLVQEPLALVKSGGIYRQERVVDADMLESADVVYLGGRTYEVSDEEVLDLMAAGYGEWVRPPIQSGYGAGFYGAGRYGG